MWLADLFRSSPGRRFFDLLDAHASVLLEAARTLAVYVDTGKPELATVVDELEHKGDDLLRGLVVAISELLVEAAVSIRSAIGAVSRDRDSARISAREASDTENRMEILYRTTLAELFQGHDFREMFKLREIYRHLS